MSIIKYNNLNTQFDALVNELSNMLWRSPTFQFERNWRPEEIKQTDTQYTIEVELPRVTKEQVKAEVLDNQLVISASTDKLQYERSFALSDADFAQSELKLENGVLSIKVPKTKPTKQALVIQ